MQNETYYYGQGRLFIAEYKNDGSPNLWRWVGDVSQLDISLTVEYENQTVSQGGRKKLIGRYLTAESLSLSTTWHEIISDNLSIYLQGIRTTTDSGKEEVTLSGIINAGDRYALEYPGVWDVVIPGLSINVDYSVEPEWGAIEFIKTPKTRPLKIQYKHAGSTSTAIFTKKQITLAVRYEGFNMAEPGDRVIVELYRVDFPPAALIELINNNAQLPGVSTTGMVLLDLSKKPDGTFGQYGRVISVPETLSLESTATPVYTTWSVGGEITTIYPK